MTILGHTTRRGFVWILNPDGTFAEIRRIEFVIHTDGIIRSSIGVQRLLQRERSDAIVRSVRRVQIAIEGVIAAASVGFCQA